MKRKPKDPHKIGWTTNKSKIKFYTENDTYHKQAIVSDTCYNGSEYKIICDWAIRDLINALNKNGVHTVFSCQGNACGSPVAYVVINPSKLSKHKLMWANEFIRNYWHDRYIGIEICQGNIAYYAYTSKQLHDLDKNVLLTSVDDKF